MALKITATDAAPIKIYGTDIPVAEIYCRLGVNLLVDGKTIDTIAMFFENKAKFDASAPEINVELVKEQEGPIQITFRKQRGFHLSDSETQSLSIAHDKVSAILVGLGYSVSIEDL